jgi:hypothetical protein
MELKVRAMLAGLFFGAWPLFMNKSGLSGNFSAFVFEVVVTILVIPFSFWNIGDLSAARWGMVLLSCTSAAIGILCFNGMLAKAEPTDMSMLFILMIVVQILVPAIYNAVLSGHISILKAFGVALAILAGIVISL